MSGIWVVYGLVDPRNGCVFYVGTSSKLKNRIEAHMSDPASAAYGVCQVLKSDGLKPDYCVFGKFLERLPAKILEGRLILALPSIVNRKSHHGLPSSLLYPDWQDLRVIQ